MTTINDTNFPALVRDDYYVAKVKFKQTDTQTYSYMVHNSLKVEAGSLLVVETNHDQFKVVEVVETASADSLEDMSISYKWAVDVVDTELFEQIKQQDKNLRAINRTRKQREERAALLAELTDNDKELIGKTGVKLLTAEKSE